jgi:hypothetical protein
MNKIFSTLSLLIFIVFVTDAQDVFNCTLNGNVTDKDTKTPITGALVVVRNTFQTESAFTDENGDFKITKLKPGRYNVSASLMGFEEAAVNEFLVNSGKEAYLNLMLQERINTLSEVVIDGKDKRRANNDFAAVSANSFSVEETKRYAATLNDPARMAQSFAGVVSSNDESNQIVVRGNSPRGMLWRLEGVEIPNPNHFAASEGATGGGVSMLSANMLANTDFYSGAFPAEYGNALSGVFDLRFRKGNSNKHEFAVQLGILGLEAAAEGPFSKKYKGSFLINYRYSTLDILGKMGITFGQNQVPKYQDLAFNFNFHINKKNIISVYGLGGISSLGNSPKLDSTAWKVKTDKESESLNQMSGVVGITHSAYFDDKTSLTTVIALSSSQNTFLFDTINNFYEKDNLEKSAFRYVQGRLSSTLYKKIDAKNTMKTGIIFSYFHYNLFNKENSGINPGIKVDNNGATQLAQGFYQWKHRFNNQLSLVSGIHFTYFVLNKKFYTEPRASLEYKFKENQSLAIGMGLHSKIDAISTYTAALKTQYGYEQNLNKELDLSRALHSVLGYNFSFLKQFRLKIEIYFQYLFQTPAGYESNNYFNAINLNDGFINIPLTSTGQGMNYGLEITLEKFFSNNYYFLFTSSLFDSKFRTDGKWYNTAFNANYVFNVVGGKEFVVGKKKTNRITSNAKFLWRGGMRQPAINLSESQVAGQVVYNFDEPYNVKLPDYIRFDFSLGFRRNQKKWNWQVGVEVQNIINRKNVAAYQYNKETKTIDVKRNIGIIPIFFIKAEF